MPSADSWIFATKSSVCFRKPASCSSTASQAPIWASKALSSCALFQAWASKSLFTTNGDILNMVSM